MILIYPDPETFAKNHGFHSMRELEDMVRDYRGDESLLRVWATSDGTKRGLFRLVGLDKTLYEVRPIGLNEAQAFIVEHHYSKSTSNTAVYCHGLFYRGEYTKLLGAALWLPPTKTAAVSVAVDGEHARVLSLSRLAIDPAVPKNGASFFLGRSIKVIRTEKRFNCLLTYADTYRNHLGYIYRATNWEYVGETPAYPIYTDSEGRMVSKKQCRNTRTHAEMLELGYRHEGSFKKHKYRMVLK